MPHENNSEVNQVGHERKLSYFTHEEQFTGTKYMKLFCIKSSDVTSAD